MNQNYIFNIYAYKVNTRKFLFTSYDTIFIQINAKSFA